MIARVREGFVPVAGAALYVRNVGRGLPLVVLHGGPDFNHNSLVPELNRLASSFHLIYYDQRGRGKSRRHRMRIGARFREHRLADDGDALARMDEIAAIDELVSAPRAA